MRVSVGYIFLKPKYTGREIMVTNVHRRSNFLFLHSSNIRHFELNMAINCTRLAENWSSIPIASPSTRSVIRPSSIRTPPTRAPQATPTPHFLLFAVIAICNKTLIWNLIIKCIPQILTILSAIISSARNYWLNIVLLYKILCHNTNVQAR